MLRRRGKVGREWLRVRAAWIQLHPPNHMGYWTCARCGRWVEQGVMELDHKLARSRRPDLRFDLTNLQPMHSRCNQQKGSRSLPG